MEFLFLKAKQSRDFSAFYKKKPVTRRIGVCYGSFKRNQTSEAIRKDSVILATVRLARSVLLHPRTQSFNENGQRRSVEAKRHGAHRALTRLARIKSKVMEARSASLETTSDHFDKVVENETEALGFLNDRLVHRVGSGFRLVSLQESVSIYKRLRVSNWHFCGRDGLERWLSMLEDFMQVCTN